MMSKRWGLTAVIAVAMALLLAACGADATATPTSAPTPTPPPQAEPTATPDEAARAQAEWDALIAAAQEEGNLSLSFNTSSGRSLRPVAAFFEEKFGIKTVVSVGSGGASANRILAERTNGQFLVDIMYSGQSTANGRMVPSGSLAPFDDFLVLPEVTDRSLWFGGRHWYGDVEQTLVFNYAASAETYDASMRYNTDIVTQEDVDAFNTVHDYLDPKWAGMIVAYTPTGSGGGGNYYQAYVHPDVGKEFLSRLLSPEMDVVFTNDLPFIVNGVAQGKFAMCIACGSAGTDIDSLASLGAPVARLTKKVTAGGVLSGTTNQVLIMLNQPNPNAGKLWINWFLSKEGATKMHTIAAQAMDPTLRVDVTEWGTTVESERRVEGEPYYFFTSDPQYLAFYDEALAYSGGLYEALPPR